MRKSYPRQSSPFRVLLVGVSCFSIFLNNNLVLREGGSVPGAGALVRGCAGAPVRVCASCAGCARAPDTLLQRSSSSIASSVSTGGTPVTEYDASVGQVSSRARPCRETKDGRDYCANGRDQVTTDESRHIRRPSQETIAVNNEWWHQWETIANQTKKQTNQEMWKEQTFPTFSYTLMKDMKKNTQQ